MSRAWTPIDDAWIDEDLDDLRKAGVKAPRGLVYTYLRRMQRRVLGFGDTPKTARQLAPILGWSKSACDRVLRTQFTHWSDPDLLVRWVDHAKAQGWALSDPSWDNSGTDAGQQRDSSGTASAHQRGTVAVRRDSTGTATGQRRDSSGNTRGSHDHRQGQRQRQEEAPPTPRKRGERSPGLPDWIQRERLPEGVTRRQLYEAVVEVLRAIREEGPRPGEHIVPVDVEACGTDAVQVLKLWRKRRSKPLAEFVAGMRLVAEAARECPDGLFARDIRAEGWPDGTDRSRRVSTLCVQEKLVDRWVVAKAWKQEQAEAQGHNTPAEAAWADVSFLLEQSAPLAAMNRDAGKDDQVEPDVCLERGSVEAQKRRAACRQAAQGSVADFHVRWVFGTDDARIGLEERWRHHYEQVAGLQVVPGDLAAGGAG